MEVPPCVAHGGDAMPANCHKLGTNVHKGKVSDLFNSFFSRNKNCRTHTCIDDMLRVVKGKGLVSDDEKKMQSSDFMRWVFIYLLSNCTAKTCVN